MLTVPVEVRKSEIHGYGVFALSNIRAGAVVWQFTPGLDQIVSLFQVQHAQPKLRDYVMARGFIDPDHPQQIVICIDEAQFMNFPLAGQPANTKLGGVLDGQHLLLASNDIAFGSEITVPPESDADYERKIKQHGT